MKNIRYGTNRRTIINVHNNVHNNCRYSSTYLYGDLQGRELTGFAVGPHDVWRQKLGAELARKNEEQHVYGLALGQLGVTMLIAGQVAPMAQRRREPALAQHAVFPVPYRRLRWSSNPRKEDKKKKRNKISVSIGS